MKPELAKQYSKSLGSRMVKAAELGDLAKKNSSDALIGLHSYDLNDSADFRNLFGFQYEAAKVCGIESCVCDKKCPES